MHLNLVKISKFIYSYRLIFLYILLYISNIFKKQTILYMDIKIIIITIYNNEKQQQRWNYLKFRLNCL